MASGLPCLSWDPWVADMTTMHIPRGLWGLHPGPVEHSHL